MDKLQSKLFHNVILHSVLFTFGLCSLIIGLFYNFNESALDNTQQAILIISLTLFSSALVFIFLIIFICIKFNQQSQAKEKISLKPHSEYDTETGLLFPDSFYKKVKDYTLISTEPACMIAFHAENIELLYRNQKESSINLKELTNSLASDKQENYFSAIKSKHEYLVFIHGYDKQSTLDLIDTMQQSLKKELLKLLKDE